MQFVNTTSSRNVILNGIRLHMNSHNDYLWHRGLGTLRIVVVGGGGDYVHTFLSIMDCLQIFYCMETQTFVALTH